MITIYTTHIPEELIDTLGDGDVFLNSEMEIIGIVHENDGKWKDEYFNPIFKNVGVKIESKQPDKIPDLEDKLSKYCGV